MDRNLGRKIKKKKSGKKPYEGPGKSGAEFLPDLSKKSRKGAENFFEVLLYTQTVRFHAKKIVTTLAFYSLARIFSSIVEIHTNIGFFEYRYRYHTVLRIRIRDPGSGAFFIPRIRDPDPGSGMEHWSDPDPGSGISKQNL
jgi:hypothetical protein